jgi:hypothetical protein
MGWYPKLKLVAYVSLVLIAFVLLKIPFTEDNLRILFAPLRVEDESLPSNATLELLDEQSSGEYGGQIHDQIA